MVTFLLRRYKIWPGAACLSKDTGYPVFRFVKDVVVNNEEVLDEQARMAELSTMKDTWNVLAVKPKITPTWW